MEIINISGSTKNPYDAILDREDIPDNYIMWINERTGDSAVGASDERPEGEDWQRYGNRTVGDQRRWRQEKQEFEQREASSPLIIEGVNINELLGLDKE